MLSHEMGKSKGRSFRGVVLDNCVAAYLFNIDIVILFCPVFYAQEYTVLSQNVLIYVQNCKILFRLISNYPSPAKMLMYTSPLNIFFPI